MFRSYYYIENYEYFYGICNVMNINNNNYYGKENVVVETQEFKFMFQVKWKIEKNKFLCIVSCNIWTECM